MQLYGRLSNLMWELTLGITTNGIAGEDTWTSEHIHYGTVGYSTIHQVLDYLKLKPADVFVDLGCGKGRVLCCAARFGIREAVGVEDSEELVTIARRNAEHLRGKLSPIRLVRQKAQEAEYDSGTVFYLFHPFGPKTLDEVLHRIRQSINPEKPAVRIAYVNPVHNEVFQDHRWLEEYERWDNRHRPRVEHPVSYWRSRG